MKSSKTYDIHSTKCNKFTEEEVKCIRNIFNQLDNDRTGEINAKKILSVCSHSRTSPIQSPPLLLTIGTTQLFPEVSEEEMQEFMTELDPKCLGMGAFQNKKAICVT